MPIPAPASFEANISPVGTLKLPLISHGMSTCIANRATGVIAGNGWCDPLWVHSLA